jgi:hypothetical protein
MPCRVSYRDINVKFKNKEIKMNTESIRKEIACLKQSPLFNLSLASKEHFHTHFIKFLCEQYPGSAMNALQDMLGIKISRLGEIKTEERNFDLLIEYNDNNTIYFEVKIKSVAVSAQLDKYAQKMEGGDVFVLLALCKPLFFSEDDVYRCSGSKICCKYVNIKSLFEAIRGNIRNGKNKYHEYLLKDYSDFIYSLLRLLDSITIKNGTELIGFSGTGIYNNFKAIKLHDLYHKYLFSQIGWRLSEKKEQDMIYYGHRNDMETKEADWDRFVVSTNFFRGTGLVECKKIIFPPKDPSPQYAVLIGVQVHNNQFRLLVSFEPESLSSRHFGKLKDLADKLFKDNDLLSFQEDETLFDEQRGQKKEICGYGKYFQYKYKTLKNNVTVDELISLVCSSVKFAKGNMDKIEEAARQIFA